MIKHFFGVLVGYAIFVISSILLFRLSGVKPHAEASVAFMIFSFIYGSLFSFISGLVTQVIAKTKNVKVNLVLFTIIAGFATFSLFKSDGSSWTQLMAIFAFAPISILGGVFIIKNGKKTIFPG